MFMSMVCVSYIMYDKIGLNLDINLSCLIGVITGLILGFLFMRSGYKK